MTTTITDREFDRIVDQLTRRGFLGAGGAAAAAALLAACGSGPTSGGGRPDETVTVDHDGESFSVPADPRRVLAVDPRDGLELAILAGYPLIAYPAGAGAHLTGRLGASASSAEVFPEDAVEPNYELIAGLNPDLLVLSGGWWDHGMYGNDRLRQIAPVLPAGVDFTPHWRTTMTEFLGSVGRAQHAEEALAAYDAHLAQARLAVAGRQTGLTVAFTAATTDSIALWRNTFRTQVARDLGLEVLLDSPDAESRLMLGLEQLDPLADADLIVALQLNSAQAYRAPTWQRLPAVQAGNVVDFDYNLASGYALTAAALLDDLVAAVQLLDR